MDKQQLTDREKIAMLTGYFLGMRPTNKAQRRSRKFMNELSQHGQESFRALFLGGFSNPLIAYDALRFFDEHINVNNAM